MKYHDSYTPPVPCLHCPSWDNCLAASENGHKMRCENFERLHLYHTALRSEIFELMAGSLFEDLDLSPFMGVAKDIVVKNGE